MQIQASPDTVRRMLQLLRDGRYLDDRSKVLRGRFITYNEPLESFATVELQLIRSENGHFAGKVPFPATYVLSLFRPV